MNKYIIGFENWRKIYSSSSHEDRKKIWVSITTSDNKELYLRKFEDWYSFQEYVNQNNLKIDKIGLRYKSNLISIDTLNSDGVYLIRSVKGQFGSKTKQCFTVGIINGDKVQKTMILTPELIEEQSYEDNIENCFEEAIIYHEQRKTSTI
jgi:hypothetical protein